MTGSGINLRAMTGKARYYTSTSAQQTEAKRTFAGAGKTDLKLDIVRRGESFG
jgi:hypothetical protein